MEFNATFDNISAILWWSDLLIERTGGTQRKPPTCHKSLTNSITTMISLVLLTRYTLKLLSSNTRKPAYNLLPQYDVGEEEEIKWNFK
jgi:hypothetical protein